MIVTLTPNPSLDRTVEVPALLRGEVLRATSSRVDPGGKGVNVARVLLANGVEAAAVLPVGGGEGAQLVDLLAAEGVKAVAVPIGAPVRANITVAEPGGTVTKLNEPGPRLSDQEVDRLLDETVQVAERTGATWIVGCGSLSPGTPDDLYARLIRGAHRAGRRVAIDTSGTPLAAALAAAPGTGPDLIKPNEEELAELVGRPLHTLGEVIDAATALRDGGVGAVLVSLGADGAVLVDAGGAMYAVPPPITVASTVGAGDATLAGYLATASAGATSGDALAGAVTWGAAAASLPGTRMPTPDDFQRLHLRDQVGVYQNPDRYHRLGRPPTPVT